MGKGAVFSVELVRGGRGNSRFVKEGGFLQYLFRRYQMNGFLGSSGFLSTVRVF